MQSSSEQEEPFIIEHRTKTGEILEFDISRAACSPFGFYYSDRVDTPRGPATVIGVRDDSLWFHIDCDKGASYWDNGKDYVDLLSIGISIIPPVQEFPEKKGYKVKKISFQNRNVNIILQNENGPCPLISISNVLALRGDVVIESNFITFDTVLDKLSAYLYEKHIDKGEQVIQQVEKSIKLLPPLQYGLDVNFNFREYDNFEKTDQCRLFDYFKIRLLHGWLVDPAEAEAHAVFGLNTYNDLMNKLVALDAPTNSSPQTPSSPTPPSTPSEEQPKKSEEAPKPPTEQDFKEGNIITQFLHQNGSQLTSYGLSVLQKNVAEGELCVFFRNNHFSTLIKYQDALYILVTDIGYERERNIVWDSLATVDGSSVFCTSDFKNTDQVNREEVVNTLVLMGYTKGQIDDCLAQIPREDLSNADNAITRALQILHKASEEQQQQQQQEVQMLHP